jgi:hypothetical protein
MLQLGNGEAKELVKSMREKDDKYKSTQELLLRRLEMD